MKKTDWIFLASLAAYSYLFWGQTPGLNFLIMTALLIAGLIVRDTKLLRDKVWLVVAGSALLTSACVAWYGNPLSVFANFFSLMLAGVFAVQKQNSFFAGIVIGITNGATAIGFIIIGIVERFNQIGGDRSSSHRKLKRTLLVLVVLFVGFLFAMMYRGSSLLFQSFTNKIDLSFISIPWCIFVLFGCIALYGFYKQQPWTLLSSWDRNRPMNLQQQERTTWFDKVMSLDSEYFSGLLLLGLLNLLLLIVNSLDIAFLFGGDQMLPDDVTYSEYVHQGIEMLIVSIIFASLIILFWFRNYHTSGKSYKRLRWLAFLWVAQNMFMIAFSIYRNHSYMYVYGLTYKRIGVDVWLLLAMAGLALMMWKISRQKTNAYVVKYFGWCCFAMLVLSAPVNWDKIIFNYNAGLKQRLDMMYANELSYLSLADQHRYDVDNYQMTAREFTDLHSKTFAFLSDSRYRIENNKWPSRNFAADKAYDQLVQMKDIEGDSVVARGYDLEAIYYFPCYSNIRTLDLANNDIVALGEVSQYKQLEELSLYGNDELTSIGGIQNCTNLKMLDLRGTNVRSFAPISMMPQLRVLKVNYMDTQTRDMLHLTNPELEITTF